jgi:plastocyanin domain-containing protein
VANIIVIVLGMGLIAGELWFFLGPKPKTTGRRAKGGGVQEIQIRVKGGYEPATVFVEAGRPVRLLFYRDETAECSERVVFDAFKIDQELPAFHTTAVTFTPKAPGDYLFTCGKHILKGRVVAQVGREAARQNLGKGHAKHG